MYSTHHLLGELRPLVTLLGGCVTRGLLTHPPQAVDEPDGLCDKEFFFFFFFWKKAGVTVHDPTGAFCIADTPVGNQLGGKDDH